MKISYNSDEHVNIISEAKVETRSFRKGYRFKYRQSRQQTKRQPNNKIGQLWTSMAA